MILLTRLNDTELLLNEDYIEIVEEVPNTTITMTNGHKYIVKENIDDILYYIKAYKERLKGDRD